MLIPATWDHSLPTIATPTPRKHPSLWDISMGRLRAPLVDVFLLETPEQHFRGKADTVLVEAPDCNRNRGISLSLGSYINTTIPMRIDTLLFPDPGFERYDFVPVDSWIMDIADFEENTVIWRLSDDSIGKSTLYIRAPHALCTLDSADESQYEDRQLKLEIEAVRRLFFERRDFKNAEEELRPSTPRSTARAISPYALPPPSIVYHSPADISPLRPISPSPDDNENTPLLDADRTHLSLPRRVAKRFRSLPFLRGS